MDPLGFGVRIPLFFSLPLVAIRKRLDSLGISPVLTLDAKPRIQATRIAKCPIPWCTKFLKRGIFIISLWIQGSAARKALEGYNLVSLPRRYLDP